MLKKFLFVLCNALIAEGFLANEIKGDRAKPLSKIGAGFEIGDVAVGKDEGFVGDFVDEMRNRKLHCNEGTKSRAMKAQELFIGAEISILYAKDEIALCFGFRHYCGIPREGGVVTGSFPANGTAWIPSFQVRPFCGAVIPTHR